MKKRISILGIIGIGLMMALAACNGPLDGLDKYTGTLLVEFGDATSRTLLPGLSMDVAEYEVSGSGPSDAEFVKKTSGSSLEIPGLVFGDWTLTANALNEDGTVIGTGSAAATVHTGTTTNVSITVRPYEGDASLSLSVLWNQADIDVPSVLATLTPVEGDALTLAFSINGAAAAYSSNTIPAGYYTLSVQLQDNGITVMGAVETVRLVKGALTSGTFEFLEVNKPGGTIDVEIIADMGDPLTVSISGLSSQLIGTAVMQLSAAIAEDVNAVYVWYVNGVSVATGQTCELAGLADGFYRVDVTAISADGKRAGSATGSFHAAGAIDLSSYMKIHEVQGASHVSPYADQVVTNVVGIVTAKDSKGFWMQSPQPDDNPATSEGLLVYFNAAPVVQVGDLVVVNGTVKEYGFNNELRMTELVSPTIVTTLATAYALPDAVVIGRGGRIPPNSIICDDGNVGASSVFDPENDGIDFWESLENMLVRMNDAVITGSGKFGELAIVADDRADVLPDRRTARGGVSIAEGNYNPEMVLLDSDAFILGLPALEAKTGDRFAAPVVGVLSYSYGNYMILPTAELTLVPGILERETSALVPQQDRLTVASFNVENFPRSVDTMTQAEIDAKVADIAGSIVHGLNSPDIIVIQEMTDDSFSANNGVVSAQANFSLLINAIVAAGGPNTYQFRQIDPVNNQDGGWTGANIRVGFIFNGARVSFVDVPGGDSTTSVSVTSVNGKPGLSASPGRIAVESFGNSRKPLAGHFVFNSRDIFVIGNHLASKGGDDPLWGINQPPVLASEVERLVQAAAVNAFVDQLLAVDSEAAVIVAGDLNDFAFSAPVRTLQDTVMYNLVDELLPSAERYTYVFDGNSQQLDHIIVSGSLFAAQPIVDVVHRYAEYPHSGRHTDHDPVLASFLIPFTGDVLPPSWISAYPAVDVSGLTSAAASFMLNEAGSVYWILLPAGSPAPSTADLLAASSMLNLQAMELGTTSFTGLVADTAYDLYAIAADTDGNVQYGPVMTSFRTEAPVVVPPSGLAGLFFSDYGEGGSNNKYLEVYNLSGAPVVLTEADGTVKFFMVLAGNGAVLSSGMNVLKFPVGMTIENGGLVGIYNGSAVAAIKEKMPASASFSSTVTYFNGDDAVALIQDLNGNGAFDLGVDAVLDLIGLPGDPTKYGLDLGFRRNADIVTGSPTWNPAEWTQYTKADVDAATYYGVHP